MSEEESNAPESFRSTARIAAAILPQRPVMAAEMKIVLYKHVVLGSGLCGTVLQGTLNSHAIAAKKSHYESSLKKEAGFVKLCNHVNVVKYLGLVEVLDKSYLIMEQARGGTLEDHLGKKKFSESQMVSIVRQMCLGLQHIHSKNILHRDIKSQNLLFRDRNLQTFVIADFGQAEFVHEESRKSNIHHVVRDSTYTFESDIYLLGLVAWQIFTDSPRFEGIDADVRIVEASCSGRSRKFFRNLGWEEAIVRSISRTPTYRPSLDSMLDAFED